MTDEELLTALLKMREAQRGRDQRATRETEAIVDAMIHLRNKPKGKTLFDTLDEWDEPATERQLRATSE